MLRRTHIALTDVTKRYGDNLVLDRISFTVKPGEKIGVVGDNGSGKSTLLRLLTGVEEPDNGEITVRSPDGVGYLPQNLDLPDEDTVADAIDLALAELRAIEAAMRRSERALAAGEDAADEYAALLSRFEAREGWEADLRVDRACAALGLPGLDRSRELGTLSGGERSRLMLAATLASRPALLLLDEPSNDLDAEAVAWLEEQIRAHPGTVVAVTHDRAFLDAVTTTMIEVADRGVGRYGDGYAGYLAAKALERRQAEEAHRQWAAELERQQGIVDANADRLGAIPRRLPLANMSTGAFRARSRGHGASSRIKVAKQRLERLRAEAVPPPPEPMRFTSHLATTGEDAADGPAVALADVTVGGRLSLPELVVEHGERVLVTGPNGAGKTTLLRVIAGELEPDEGTVTRRGAVGHLRQRSAPGADHRSVLRAFAEGRVGTLEEHTEALLRLGLFAPERFGAPVSALSVGQRRRLELARLVTAPVDVLLLDEPTNHLSPVLAEELQEALVSYTGTVILVSHDRRLRESFTGRRLEMEAGSLTAVP